MEGEDSFETIADGDEQMEPVEDDGSTFTFAADAPTAGVPDHESVGDQQDPEFAEDATTQADVDYLKRIAGEGRIPRAAPERQPRSGNGSDDNGNCTH
jgi:hypothetical protein